MRIAIIIVVYNTPKHEVVRLQKQIERLHLPNAKTFIVNNTKQNRGFAAGVNRGIYRAGISKYDYFIVMNPDVSVSRLRGSKMLDGSSRFDIWGFAMKQDKEIYYGGKLDRWRMSSILVRRKPTTRFVRRDFVTGSLMIVAREVIERIGLFDESYFMYYEDVEYCRRAVRHGFRVGIDSSLMYLHYEWSKNNPQKAKYLAKNRLKFLVQYGTISQKLYELIRSPKTLFEYVRGTMR